MNEKIYLRKIDGREFKVSDLVEELNWARNLEWTKINWKKRDALVDKKSGTVRLYVGQKYNPEYFDFVNKGWTHDHCDICFSKVESNDIAYESDAQILCSYCYFEFIAPKNIDSIFN